MMKSLSLEIMVNRNSADPYKSRIGQFLSVSHAIEYEGGEGMADSSSLDEISQGVIEQAKTSACIG